MDAEQPSPTAPDSAGSVSLLGYGSLMSGLGLRGLRPLPARRVDRVRLLNCRRGFGKPSQYGDRLAMVLEPLHDDEPIRAAAVDAENDGASPLPEALLVDISTQDLMRVARREGYSPDALLSLDERARSENATLPDHLLALLVSVSFDLAAYRRELARSIGYTSRHYIPHPVPADDGSVALTFLAPGTEGSGDDDVVPLRVAAGSTALLSMVDAWRAKPNASQLEYFLMCLLGGVHNLSLADVCDALDAEHDLSSRLAELAPPEIAAEPERLRDVLRLSADQYERGLGQGSNRSSFLQRCFPWYGRG